MPKQGETFINAIGVEVVAHGGSTPRVDRSKSHSGPSTQTARVATEKHDLDIYGRLYDNDVPVFISLNDPSGLVIDRLVFDGPQGTGTSGYLVNVDTLIDLRRKTRHTWGPNEHSYFFPDPADPPVPGDDLYPFYEWLLINFPGWPNNGGLQPQPGWGGGTPPIDSPPLNGVAPSLSGDGFIGEAILLDDGQWSVNPVETDRFRRWYFDGKEDATLRQATQYTPVMDDWGKVVTAEVEVWNDEGETIAPTSNSVQIGGVRPLEAHPDFDLVDGIGPSGWYMDTEKEVGHDGTRLSDVHFVQYASIETTDLIVDVDTLIDETLPSSDTVHQPRFVFRWVDADNYIFINVDLPNGNWRLVERVAAVQNILAEIPYTGPEAMHLELLVADVNWTVGAETRNVTTTHAVRGMVGLEGRTGQTINPLDMIKNWQYVLLDDFFVELPPVIDGIGEVGQTLAVIQEPMFSINPTGTTRQWLTAGNIIPSETGTQYRVQESDRGRNITVEYMASDGIRTLVVQSNAIYVVAPPKAVTPPVIEADNEGFPGALLSFTSEGVWDIAPLPETGRTYQWRLNGVDIVGATSDTYQTTDESQNGNYTCVVTVTTADGSVSQNSNTMGISGWMPITDNAGWYDLAGNDGAENTRLYANESTIEALATTAPEMAVVRSDGVETWNQSMSIRMGFNSAGFEDQSFFASVRMADALNFVGLSCSNQNLQVWERIAGVYTRLDLMPQPAIGTPLTIEAFGDQIRVFTDAGEVMSGTTRVLDKGYQGLLLRNSDGNPTTICEYVSIDTSFAQPAIPVLETNVTIQGYILAPSELTCQAGTWSGGADNPAIAYQWRRDGVDIIGETGASYNWTIADDNNTEITCAVTGTNVAGSTTVVSNVLRPAAFAPVNTVAPAISGYYSEVAWTVSNGTWTTDPAMPITFSYAWKIAGATVSTAATFTPTEVNNLWDDVTCEVTATNAAGDTTVTTASIKVRPPNDQTRWQKLDLLIKFTSGDPTTDKNGIGYYRYQHGSIDPKIFPAVDGSDLELTILNCLDAGQSVAVGKQGDLPWANANVAIRWHYLLDAGMRDQFVPWDGTTRYASSVSNVPLYNALIGDINQTKEVWRELINDETLQLHIGSPTASPTAASVGYWYDGGAWVDPGSLTPNEMTSLPINGFYADQAATTVEIAFASAPPNKGENWRIRATTMGQTFMMEMESAKNWKVRNRGDLWTLFSNNFNTTHDLTLEWVYADEVDFNWTIGKDFNNNGIGYYSASQGNVSYGFLDPVYFRGSRFVGILTVANSNEIFDVRFGGQLAQGETQITVTIPGWGDIVCQYDGFNYRSSPNLGLANWLRAREGDTLGITLKVTA